MNKTFLTLTLCLLAASVALAHVRATAQAPVLTDEMKKLDFIVGEWKGYGRKNPLEAKLVGDKTLQYGIPFSVSFEPSEGNRRATIQITDAGEWHETLEVWHLGRWSLVEESTLKRIK